MEKPAEVYGYQSYPITDTDEYNKKRRIDGPATRNMWLNIYRSPEMNKSLTIHLLPEGGINEGSTRVSRTCGLFCPETLPQSSVCANVLLVTCLVFSVLRRSPQSSLRAKVPESLPYLCWYLYFPEGSTCMLSSLAYFSATDRQVLYE